MIGSDEKAFKVFKSQVQGAVSATLTQRGWMDVTSCAVEGDITLSRKGDGDNYEMMMRTMI